MRIVYMGTPDFAVASLERLIADGHDIAAVFTQPDKPQGRKMKLTPPPVKQLAMQHDIPVYQPDTFKNESQLALLQELDPEVIVVVAYGKLLPGYVLDLPEYGCINVHGSLLPKYRGAAPVQWMVLNGEKTAGVTTMYMDRGLDTGDILLMRETEVGENETAGELFDRLAAMGADLISETLARLPEGIARTPQDESASTYVSVLDKSMAVVDWTKSAQEVHNLIRGLDPWPVALTTREGGRLKLFQSRLTGRTADAAPGTVVEADPKSGLFVACGDGGVLQILEVQMVGKKRMPAGDYLRGHAMQPGTVLGD
ncbi:methionyl-tRNA formyltransferase [Butyricicoccus sp.]|uniref:methionyl-tRNA formyltransferase n=1 Tax=Butyricicoccus sp. TaxID=2049021 RepID=UPI003F144971